jgi:hypothetical protein
MGHPLLVFLLVLDGEVQGIANESVNIAMKAGVLRDDPVHCLCEAYFLHAVMVLKKPKPANLGGSRRSVNCAEGQLSAPFL